MFRNVNVEYLAGMKTNKLSGFLEVADIVNHKLRYIPIPG